MDDLVINKVFLEPIEGYSSEEMEKEMIRIAALAMRIFRSKDKDYKGSWQRRGILSAQMNFERKTDRVVAMFNQGALTTTNTNENIVDTFVDTSVYSLLYLVYLCKKDPNVRKQLDELARRYDGEDQA